MVRERIRKVLEKIIPYKILHRSSLKLKDQEIENYKKISELSLEDKRSWREAYFKKRYDKPRTSPEP